MRKMLVWCLSLGLFNTAYSKETRFCLESNQCYEGVRTIKEAPASKLYTVWDFELEKSTLADVLNKFKLGQIVKTGDAGRSLTSLCYMNQGGHYIAFTSDEMGGGETLTSIILSKNKIHGQRLGKCAKANNLPSDFSTASGLKLGMDLAAVEKQLGSPSKSSKGLLIYLFQSPKKLDGKSDEFTEQVTLVLRHKTAKIQTIELSKVTVN